MPDAVARLAAGLKLWRGEALADAGLESWAVAEVQRLTEVRLDAVEDLWDARVQLGDHVAAVGELERQLVATPLRERLVGLLMLALYRCGRHSDALDRYERLRVRLAEDLGVDPGPKLQSLHMAILRRESSLEPKPNPVHAPIPAQLPRPVGHFAGRTDELAALADPAACIVVVSGPAGIGKTALAVQWAHQVKHRYPDGQLFLDLRGHDPDAALTPADALTHVLRGLGVPPDRIPAGVADQTGLYRSLVHDRRVLIILDNGGTADHVSPLVPPTVSSTLVVTSRSQLSALAIDHAVQSAELDVLAVDEAHGLINRVLGVQRVEREQAAAFELIELCGRMPLALRIAAAKLAARPRQPIAGLVAELSDDRLDALQVTGDSRSVRTVFASAYNALSEPAARLFRLLGLHPGTSFGTRLAAAVMGLSHGRARRSVDELSAAHLIMETERGQYRFHDLIRLYASECAKTDETTAQRDAAAHRIIDWYLAIADAANSTLDPTRTRITAAIADPPAELPFAAESDEVLAFLDGERGNIVPVVALAAESHELTACHMTYLLAGFLDRRGHWTDWVATCRWGVTAANRLGDPELGGLMRSALGVSCIFTRRFDEALDVLHEALAMTQASGNVRDEGYVHNNLAVANAGLRRFDEAAESFGRALELHTGTSPAAMASALNNLGYAHTENGDFAIGLKHLTQALTLAKDAEDVTLQAAILHSLGVANRAKGDHDQALAFLHESLALYREIGYKRHIPGGINDIGEALLLRGDHTQALAEFVTALEISTELGDQHCEAISLGNIARAHLRAGDLPAARHHLTRALDLRVRFPDAYEEAHLHRWMSRFAAASGDAAAAATHRDHAVQLYIKANAVAEADELAGVTVDSDS
ncbi:tetratricopeptide (TPR) repeat protein [Kibdelosporangium banguiense]|uniref:Tetratricopeptide (TPR) repeat protein n=1 Tax=Kibdelosporangium banguiense TaxID=1365924 RepID=A0ABS4TZL3_9PSEU|nr:tetratricopeptide (TPR) repeat protein [Kibdelosporangium banguiense]